MSTRIDRREITLGTTVLSLAALGLMLVPLLGTDNFTPRLLAGVTDNFLGLPPIAFVATWVVIAWMPLPVWFWHLIVVQHYARDHASRTRIKGMSDIARTWIVIEYLKFLATSKDPDATLRRAKRIAFLGVCYLIGLVIWWAYWSDEHLSRRR